MNFVRLSFNSFSNFIQHSRKAWQRYLSFRIGLDVRTAHSKRRLWLSWLLGFFTRIRSCGKEIMDCSRGKNLSPCFSFISRYGWHDASAIFLWFSLSAISLPPSPMAREQEFMSRIFIGFNCSSQCLHLEGKTLFTKRF